MDSSYSQKSSSKKEKRWFFFYGLLRIVKKKSWTKKLYTRPVCVCSISFFCKTSPRDHPQKGEERERKREKPINRECCSTGWQGVPSVHVLEGHRERTSAGGGRSSSCLLSFLCDMKTFTLKPFFSFFIYFSLIDGTPITQLSNYISQRISKTFSSVVIKETIMTVAKLIVSFFD